MNSVWINSQPLWAVAQKRVAQEIPKWTLAFWRKVAEVYQELGGKLIDDEPTPEFIDERRTEDS